MKKKRKIETAVIYKESYVDYDATNSVFQRASKSFERKIGRRLKRLGVTDSFRIFWFFRKPKRQPKIGNEYIGELNIFYYLPKDPEADFIVHTHSPINFTHRKSLKHIPKLVESVYSGVFYRDPDDWFLAHSATMIKNARKIAVWNAL